MLKVLEDLVVLQEIDLKRGALLREIGDLPNRKALAEARLSDRRQRLTEAEDAWKKNAAAIKEIEVEIETLRQQIAKMLSQQYEVKNNDQYRALMAEIAGARDKIRALEDREIERMEESETLKAALEQVKAELQSDERETAEAVREFDARDAQLRREAEGLESERAGRAAGIEPDWLARYERILQHHGDRAVVPIERQACGGCHMKLTPQTIQDARRAQSIVTCGYCGRLLYWKE